MFLLKRLFVFSTLALILSLGLFGCVKTQKPVVNTNQNQNTNVEANTNTNVATTTEGIDTSNWKTYRNEEYGFEFKYPEELSVKDWAYKTPNWELLLHVGHNKDIGDEVVSIGAEKDRKIFDSEKIFWPVPRESMQIKKVVIGKGDYPAYEVLLNFNSVDGNAHSLNYFIQQPNRLLEVSYNYKYKELDEEIFKIILSSFTFTQ